ncbi:LpxL/LpxP family Kdo(2)-lipid IV(A) lauroyl/palmitoleoyl acyltransferase [Vibrio maritimus]|uniref:LpxL/LpxP family Kdo(2)-lipid IV(A) lauroyl/palmitoleoyl acyltransferase n=1 Tax=Vibrio maritimus TaxID=990268 RepID=UPI004068AD37
MKIIPSPKFTITLLHPRYWVVWIGFALLAVIVNILPYFLLRSIGECIGLVAMKILKKRGLVAKTNFQLCFPGKSEADYLKLVSTNFKYTGMALIETGIAWFWPKWRILKISSFIGQETIKEQNGKGVLILCTHHLNLELTACIFSQFCQGYGVYRPNSNPAYEFVQHRGRTRFGHKMVDRKDLRTMIKLLKNGAKLWYLPDHDYGKESSVYAPFFSVKKAATTMGTTILADLTDCAIISGVTVFHNNHYTLHIGDNLSEKINRRDSMSTATVINKEIEKMIERDIPAWMWLHKRFKTRPEGENSLYSL